MVEIVTAPAGAEQVSRLLVPLGQYIKLAVDIRRGILAAGGLLHADCEAALLEDGSRQEDTWGADWYPADRRVEFGALINLRPAQDNRSMEIQDPEIRRHVERIARTLLGGP